MRKMLPLAALFLASLNLRPAISSVSPLLGTIRDDLHMNGSAASLLTSIPVLCMGIFAPFAVRLSSRWGLERILTLAMLLVGAATAIRLFAHSSFYLLLTAFLAGIGIAVSGPLLSGFVKRSFANATAMVGVYSMSLVLGAAVSSGLAVPLQGAMSGSWRGALAIWAALAVAAIPFWMLLTRKNGDRGGPAAARRSGAAIRIPWGSGRAWLLTVFFGVMGTLFYSLMAWLSPIVEAMGYDSATAGAVLTLFAIIQLPVSLVLPILMSRYPRRLMWMLLCASSELAGLILLLLSHSPWAAAALLGIGAGGLFPIALMLPIDETSTGEEAGAWSALTQFGGYIISSLGPLLVGWLHDRTGGFASALGVLAALVLILMMLQRLIGNKRAADRPSVEASAGLRNAAMRE